VQPPLADAAQTRPRRPTGVFVHIDAPRLVELEIKGYDRWDEFHSVCISPCDTEVPVDFSYRVGGDDVHSSRVFSFPTGATRQTRPAPGRRRRPAVAAGRRMARTASARACADANPDREVLGARLRLSKSQAVGFMSSMSKSIYEFIAKTIDGTPKTLGDYKGKVLLVVNVASKCGLTPQYEGLEKLHEAYAAKGLAVLGFPANEFGAQEPGTNEQVKEFCTTNYGVKFDMFAKVKVKGPGIDPLFDYLTSNETNPGFSGDIKWNFNKFLIGKNGQVLARFEPPVDPTSPEVKGAIEKALA